MMSQNKLGCTCALCYDQGIKLSGNVPFVTLVRLVEELPSSNSQNKDLHVSQQIDVQSCKVSHLFKVTEVLVPPEALQVVEGIDVVEGVPVVGL